MFGLFKKKTDFISSEENFWNWFLNHKSKIEKFIDSEHADYSIYNELTSKIKSYNNLLFPELTKTSDNKYVLIITPDGMKEGVAPTKKLAEGHPEIKNWVIEKFRQPSDQITLNFKGLEFPTSDIEIMPQIDEEGEKVNINVFIKNMNTDEEKYKSLAFLYLDHILGEFNTITKVGYIDFQNLEKGKNIEGSISLLELRNLIAQELY